MRRKVRSKHNNLLNYFIHDARDLSPAYLASCRKFFKELSPKPQAPSCKPEGWPSGKLDKLQAVGYNRIMKTFIFEDKEYQFKDMEEANDKLPLGDGAWFGPKEGMPANTYKWEKGNFFD